jgi:hypothetical protein
MFEYLTKIALTTALVVGVSEIAKRSTLAAAVVASLPLTSLLAFVWLYLETGDFKKVAVLSQGIFWLVLASLPFFLVLPSLFRSGWGFWPSMGLASVTSVVAYLAAMYFLTRMGATG